MRLHTPTKGRPHRIAPTESIQILYILSKRDFSEIADDYGVFAYGVCIGVSDLEVVDLAGIGSWSYCDVLDSDGAL